MPSHIVTPPAPALSPEEAEKYANSIGLLLNAEEEWVQPALGFTFGRYTAGQFTDPRTSAYNNFSGVVDFGTGATTITGAVAVQR